MVAKTTTLLFPPPSPSSPPLIPTPHPHPSSPPLIPTPHPPPRPTPSTRTVKPPKTQGNQRPPPTRTHGEGIRDEVHANGSGPLWLPGTAANPMAAAKALCIHLQEPAALVESLENPVSNHAPAVCSRYIWATNCALVCSASVHEWSSGSLCHLCTTPNFSTAIRNNPMSPKCHGFRLRSFFLNPANCSLRSGSAPQVQPAG